MPVFLFLYIGLVFLLICTAVISVQQLTEIGANLCVTCGVLLLIYGGYYLLTALACEKMIFHYSERQ